MSTGEPTTASQVRIALKLIRLRMEIKLESASPQLHGLNEGIVDMPKKMGFFLRRKRRGDGR